MKEPKWILVDVVLLVQQMLISEHGGVPGLRDASLLESALHRPIDAFTYGDVESVPGLAASYCASLARDHPFVDGNKRISLTVAGMFLDVNGYTLVAPEPEAAVVIESLAAGELDEADLAAWFIQNSQKG